MGLDQPLHGVKAFVDVKSKYANNSLAVLEELKKLGASVSDKLDASVSHVIFKDGCKITEARAKKFGIPMVGLTWLDSCKRANARVEEKAFSVVYSTNCRRKQKPLQPKEYTAELQHASDKLARVKKRRSGVQIPSPLDIVADRINLNSYLQVPRTPPHMQRRLDELREKNLSSLRDTESKAVVSEQDARMSLGCSPQLPLSQNVASQVIVPCTTYKAPRSASDAFGEVCDGLEDHVVPESPMSFNISKRLDLSLSPEKNPSNSLTSFCSINEKTGDDRPCSEPSSPTLNWDLAVNSFMNEGANGRSIHTSDKGITILPSNTDQTADSSSNLCQNKHFIKTNECNKTKESPSQSTRKHLLTPNQGKQRKKFVPPFLNRKDKESNGKVLAANEISTEVSSETAASLRVSRVENEGKSEQPASWVATEGIEGAVIQTGLSKVTVAEKETKTCDITRKVPVESHSNKQQITVSHLLKIHSQVIKKTGGEKRDQCRPVAKKRGLTKPKGRTRNSRYLSSSTLDCSRNSTGTPYQLRSLRSSLGNQQMATDGDLLHVDGSASLTGQDAPHACGGTAQVNEDLPLVDGETSSCGNTPTTDREISLADGEMSLADAEMSLVDGEMPKADDGEMSKADGQMSLADGEMSKVDGEMPKADGEISLADGEMSLAGGEMSKSHGEVSLAESEMSKADGERSLTDDAVSKADGEMSLADGEMSKSHGEMSLAEGETSKCHGEMSLAEGEMTKADGEMSLTDGEVSKADGEMSKADSEMSLADREMSLADGEVMMENGEESLVSKESSCTDGSFGRSACLSESSDSPKPPSTRALTNISNTLTQDGVVSRPIFSNAGRSSSDTDVHKNVSIIDIPEDHTWLFDSPQRPTRSNSYPDGQPKKKPNIGSGRRKLKMPLNMVLTSLHSGDRAMTKSIIKKLGGFNINMTVDKNTSHVVCGDGRRTLNALKGISYGCWVVSVQWVLISLETGKWAENIEDFLMTEAFPGVTLQRCRLLTKSNRLFASVGPIHVTHGTTPPCVELREIIRINGGEVVRTRRACKMMVGTASDATTYSSVIKENWILDCVTHQKLFDHRPYRWEADLSRDMSACNIFDS